MEQDKDGVRENFSTQSSSTAVKVSSTRASGSMIALYRIMRLFLNNNKQSRFIPFS